MSYFCHCEERWWLRGVAEANSERILRLRSEQAPQSRDCLAIIQLVGDKPQPYDKGNPKGNQKAKVKMQNVRATVNKRLKCKNTEQR